MWYNVVKHIKALSIMERSITMSEKRRDNKNRILRTGESQRKDGRYAYKYIDTFGYSVEGKRERNPKRP